jgi:hypothetical protein
VDRFSGEVPGDVRKVVSADFTGTACFVVVGGLRGEVSKDSITLVSATETSAGGGSLDLTFITLSSRGFLNNWSEETVKLSCRLKIGGSLVFGGNTAELIGDVGTTPERRILCLG